MGAFAKMSDRRLASLIYNTADFIEQIGQPSTEIETQHYFNRYETFWTAMVERDLRAHG